MLRLIHSFKVSPPCINRCSAVLAASILIMGVSLGAGNDGTGRAAVAKLVKDREPLFAYDRRADFDVRENGAETRGDAVVRDISFLANPGGKEERVAAYLVVPRVRAPRAAILWVHWLGDPETTNRTEFLAEAEALAGRGVVSLLVDAMWAKPYWYRDRVLKEDYARSVAQVIALRRALDLLQQQPGASETPLGIVGHDYGGMHASIVAGLESRAKTCVFVACTASLLDWAFFVEKPSSMDDYLRENRRLELRDYVGAIEGASLLFQFAEHDKYVPLAKAQEFFAVAGARKQMIVYGGADHRMAAPAAIHIDRTEWLTLELRLE